MRRFVAAALAVLPAAGVTIAFAAALIVAPSVLSTTSRDVSGVGAPVPATIDLKPESLQKRSSGAAVTATIELPSGFDVRAIAVGSVRLCAGTTVCDGGVPASKPQWGDADRDGIADLKVQFDRSRVVALVAGVTPPATATFTVYGFVSRRLFLGVDTVRIVGARVTGASDASPSEPPASGEAAGGTPGDDATSGSSPDPTSSATPGPASSPSPDAASTVTPDPASTPSPDPDPSSTPDQSASSPTPSTSSASPASADS
jgi:hypothetical protein